MKNKPGIIVFLLIALGLVVGLPTVLYLKKQAQNRLDRAIVEAAQAGDFERVRVLVAEGASPVGRHFPNPDGSMSYPYQPPIEYACKAGDIQTVQFLIQHGIELNQDGRGSNLLADAIYNDDREMIVCLLEHGANPNGSPEWSIDYNMLALLVDLEWKEQYSTDEALELMALAIEYGADPNRHGVHGMTPLLMAVVNESPRLVTFLLEQGGDPSAVSDRGMNAMDYATFRANAEIIDLLRQNGSVYGVQEAVSLGRLDDVKAFIADHPALVTETFIDGDSLLGLSLQNGHKGLSKVLIDAGSDLNHLNNDQETLLHLAARGNDAQVVAYLIDQGLDVNARDRSQGTPLHETTYSDRALAAAVLIERGANLNARASSEITPTQWASSYDSPGVLRLLLEAGCDPNQPGAYDGAIPLGSACHYASTDQVPESVKVLLKYGADVNHIGSQGRPAIHWAVEWFGGVPLVTYLLEHGADPMIIDDNGETAMDIARRGNKTQVLVVLENWLSNQNQ